ncbi:hypothetical protein JGH11_06715 [Dysgonomonas sp. Marseille-P4677]|uniref:hypothetical protein n=1 Tax=Dysgonomonas sp. Marseille-P4677 TaxID=2364790 RepID=UPI00191286F9|nr:hypothetical protein [Dysgonomonas sp. Marseille-P4677]MBK5720559.1 hypothetical protein [Dysgonomonas sp. Marseille-P4677]
MNTFFSIDRFWKVGKRNIYLSKTQFIYIAGGLIGLYLLSMLLYILTENQLNGLIFFAAATLIITSPCFLERNISKHASILDFTLPASTFEKYLCIWIKYVLFLPLLIFLILFILNLISSIIPNESINEHAVKMSVDQLFRSKILNLIVLNQAFFMAGYFYFRKYAFAKTCLIMLLLSTILIFIAILIGHFALKGGNLSMDLSSNTPHETAFNIGYSTGKTIGLDIFRNSIISTLEKAIDVVLIVGLWVISFFKLRETEI